LRIYDLIETKKKGLPLSKEQIYFFIAGVTNGEIPDYQISAFLMAIVLKGMNDEETYNLTMAMLYSGKVLDKGGINGTTVDKHSTGGVSDSTTLIVVPIVCSLGLKFAKLSGRGLGFTGGTLDKLESFKGFNVNLTDKQFTDYVNNTGAAIAGQTKQTVPADKKLYAIRDVTATVDSIPLIASSIMSKKLSSFADIILLDVKYGSGGFMKNKEDAAKLGLAMVSIGNAAGRKTAAFVTSMQQPLGNFIGCDLEVKNAIDILRGEINNDLADVSLNLSAKIVSLAENISFDIAMKKCKEAIISGKALNKLIEIVKTQNGSIEMFKSYKIKSKIEIINSIKSGYITKIDSEKLGNANAILGGGRLKKEDNIDHSAGLELLKRLGQKISKDEPLIKIYHNDKGLIEAKELIESAFVIEEKQAKIPKLIAAYIDDSGINWR
jgi:pyrimidine-nucleoside phosphorylase